MVTWFLIIFNLREIIFCTAVSCYLLAVIIQYRFKVSSKSRILNMSTSVESIWGWLHALEKTSVFNVINILCGYTDVKLTPCWSRKVWIYDIPAGNTEIVECDVSVFWCAVIPNRTALIAPNQKHFKAATCPLYCLLARIGVQRMCCQSFGSVFTWSQSLNT